MTADKKAAPTQSDYIPISTSVINGLELVKPNVTEPKDAEFNVPLTPSPSDPSETDSFTDKIVEDHCSSLFSYNPGPGFTPTVPTSSSYTPPLAFPQTTTPENSVGYYTPPTPFLTPSPVNNPQTFLFDPAFIPQLYAYPASLPAAQPHFNHHHNETNIPTPDITITQQPPAKRPKKSSKKPTAKARKSGIAKTVLEMKTTLLEYHNAGSDEMWRAGGEPRKKSKHCQTTFKHPLQFTSLEEFTGLSVLLQIFGKEASQDASRRIGAKSKGNG